MLLSNTDRKIWSILANELAQLKHRMWPRWEH